MIQAQQPGLLVSREEIESLAEEGYTLPEPVRWRDLDDGWEVLEKLKEVMHFMSADCAVEDMAWDFVAHACDELTYFAPPGYRFSTVGEAQTSGMFRYMKER